MTPAELKTLFSENLKARRKELGMTQAAVADALGVAAPYIVALEKGHKSPRLENVARLAEVLQTTPSALLSAGNFSKVS